MTTPKPPAKPAEDRPDNPLVHDQELARLTARAEVIAAELGTVVGQMTAMLRGAYER